MKKNNDQDDQDGQEPCDMIATSLYIDGFIKWFFSKYPDLEDPKLKRYPGDNRPNGKGIFESIDECNIHYFYRLALSTIIEYFAKDVMMKIDIPYSPKKKFEIDWEFMEKHIGIMKHLLGVIFINKYIMRKNNGV